jgi:hypothetical protein
MTNEQILAEIKRVKSDELPKHAIYSDMWHFWTGYITALWYALNDDV